MHRAVHRFTSRTRAIRTLLTLACLPPAIAHAQFAITEFQASNDGTISDTDGESSDWIEVTNTSATAANLQAWSLTDDPDETAQWTFPNLTLDPGKALVVFASAKNRADPNAQLHTNFRLAAGGGYLALTSPDGDRASEFNPYPAQTAAYSLGTTAGNPDLVFFPTPTPGQPNPTTGFQGFLQPVTFSHSRGLLDTPFQLQLTAGPGETIRYTTDGSDPTAGTEYTAPIEITTTTVLRAIAQHPGFVTSEITTHTYLFPADIVTQSANGSAPPGWPTRPVNRQEFYYQMHPDAVAAAGQANVTAALLALPSLSLVTPLQNLTDRSTGIYANPENRGRDWERPGSLELLEPDGTTGFQAGCGIRIRGGISRDPQNPKHSFRLLFRSEYGDAKLRWPIFGDNGAGEFDNLDLRTSTNWNWAWFGAFRPGAIQNTFLRDIVSRDLQGAMGMAHTRSRYYHLYLNGVYWGIYMTQERSEASYAESYLGGTADDYDVVKVNRGPGPHTEATDGDLDAWRALSQQSRRHRTNPTLTSYLKMQGLDETGTRDESLPVLLDADALIDYMLAIFWTANNDAPVSQWGDNDWSNNWYGIRNRTTADSGFRYLVHDAENSFGISGYDLNFSRVITTTDRTGPYQGPAYRTADFDMFNPQFLHQDLLGNPEYRLRFADRVQRFCTHAGTLTDASVMSLLTTRKTQLEPAIPAQAARWGYRFASQGLRYDQATWETAVATIEQFIDGRTDVVLTQLARDNLLSEIDAPAFNQRSGTVPAGFALTMTPGTLGTFETGEVYYTTDGSDPRLPGGQTSPSAQRAAAFPLTQTTRILARVRATRTGDEEIAWSALEDITILVDAVPADQSNIVISEIHYHPLPATDAEKAAGFTRGANFEFIELHNPTAVAVSLAGTRIADGISFEFTAAEIPPGGYAVLVNNAPAFRARYGDTPQILGEFSGDLSNGGERVVLLDTTNTPLAEIEFDDENGWPPQADGNGSSLVAFSPTPGSTNPPSDWGASHDPGGSPGRADTAWPDCDGDGSDDRSEWIAGTDRTDPASVFAITNIVRRPTSLELSCPGIAGRRYQLTRTTGSGSTLQWLPIGPSQQPDIDTELTFQHTAPTSPTLYRIQVQRP